MQVQTRQPPEKKRGEGAPVPSFPEDSKEVLGFGHSGAKWVRVDTPVK